jgi:hypothetical protein
MIQLTMTNCNKIFVFFLLLLLYRVTIIVVTSFIQTDVISVISIYKQLNLIVINTTISHELLLHFVRKL